MIFHCFQLENGFIYYISKKKSKDKASLLERKSYLLEAESDKAKTARCCWLLCCCVASGSSHFSLLMRIFGFCNFFNWRHSMRIILGPKRSHLLYKNNVGLFLN